MATKAEQKAWREEMKKKLAEQRKVWQEKLADVRGKPRASSPGASQTAIKKSAEDNPSVETGAPSSLFTMLKGAVVVGGIGAGIWYYYHSGAPK
jgi:hypothetical protein